jgi:hypothetical protein
MWSYTSTPYAFTVWYLVQQRDNFMNIEFYRSRILCHKGSCHHGMARPRVEDGRQPPDMEGNWEY